MTEPNPLDETTEPENRINRYYWNSRLTKMTSPKTWKITNAITEANTDTYSHENTNKITKTRTVIFSQLIMSKLHTQDWQKEQ